MKTLSRMVALISIILLVGCEYSEEEIQQAISEIGSPIQGEITDSGITDLQFAAISGGRRILDRAEDGGFDSEIGETEDTWGYSCLKGSYIAFNVDALGNNLSFYVRCTDSVTIERDFRKKMAKAFKGYNLQKNGSDETLNFSNNLWWGVYYDVNDETEYAFSWKYRRATKIVDNVKQYGDFRFKDGNLEVDFSGTGSFDLEHVEVWSI